MLKQVIARSVVTKQSRLGERDCFGLCPRNDKLVIFRIANPRFLSRITTSFAGETLIFLPASISLPGKECLQGLHMLGTVVTQSLKRTG